MKIFPLALLVLCISLFALGQTRPKVDQPPTKKPIQTKPSPDKKTPTKTTAAKNAATKKVTSSTVAKTPATGKPKQTPAKPVKNTLPKDETTRWENVEDEFDPYLKLKLLRKFIADFPDSKRRPEAFRTLVDVQTKLANDRLTVSDFDGALKLYKAALNDAPKPLTDELFRATVAKAPANLFFRGGRTQGVEMARALETRAETIDQVLALATFYMSIENGTEAKRLAEAALKIDPNSSHAYQTLGLAHRIDFELEESAAAYARALEIDPASASARRGLAEMKRALGSADQAVELYREILKVNPDDSSARAGLVLSLFESGNKSEAESELEKALVANPSHVVLLGGAAYWYAVHNDGNKAVELATKALEIDPRFVWSHIALSRGLLAKKQPVAAEKALLKARRYGNFPSLQYEIATARAAAGLYREAAEELAKSFSVRDGMITTKVGGRVARESKYFTELVGLERRASISAPTAADDPENARRLKALLQLKQELDSPTPDPEKLVAVADEFIKGDDGMRVHRKLFVADRLLDKKIALKAAIDLAKSATTELEKGLEVADPTVAVLSDELYESRSLADVRGEYINVPEAPKQTLLSILRGRVESISGWANYQLDDTSESITRLRRAVSVLPADSAWWRTATWRLGTALVQSGKDAEALDWYIRSYRSSPVPVNYGVIAALYQKVNGSVDGLESKIGPAPAGFASVATPPVVTPAPVATPAAGSVPVPAGKTESEIQTSIPAAVPVARPSETTLAETIRKTPANEPALSVSKNPEKSLEPVGSKKQDSKPPDEPAGKDTSAEHAAATRTSDDIPTTSNQRSQPNAVESSGSKTEAPRTEISRDKPLRSATEKNPGVKDEAARADAKLASDSDTAANAVTSASRKTSDAGSRSSIRPNPPSRNTTELFPPVVITIPGVETPRSGSDVTENFRPGVKPCSLTFSEDEIRLKKAGGDIAVIIGRDDDEELGTIAAVSTSPENVKVRREDIAGVKTRALFVLSSVSDRTGVFQVRFETECGKRDLVVHVR